MRHQGAAYVTTGTQLIVSSEGNVMLTFDGGQLRASRHLGRAPARARANSVRFGHATKYLHACRENFVLEVGRHGMTKRDIVPNINFFMNVPIEPSGELAIVDGVSKPGDYVELLAEMDVLCVISNCPQINNPVQRLQPDTRSSVLIWDAEA